MSTNNQWRLTGTDRHGRPIYSPDIWIGHISRIFPSAFSLLTDGPVVLVWNGTTATLFAGMTADEWLESWSLRREAYQRGADGARAVVVHEPAADIGAGGGAG